MSLKPKHARLQEPKFKEREDEPTSYPCEFDAAFDAFALADAPIKPFGPCTNDIMREMLTKALNR